MRTVRNAIVRDDGFTLYRMTRVIDGVPLGLVLMVPSAERAVGRTAVARRIRDARAQLAAAVAAARQQ